VKQILGMRIFPRRLASAAKSLRPIVAVVLSSGLLFAQSVTITNSNWGSVTAPVYGSTEANPNYSAAELFAGPNKLGSYYAGVLPNGRKVTPAGTSIQIGMNPLGMAVTPDGHFVVTSDDDEREGTLSSYQSSVNKGGYTLTVIDTTTMSVVSEFKSTTRYFIGMLATGTGPYTIWTSGGPDNDVKLFSLSTAGVLTAGTPASIKIFPITPLTQGFVSNYVPGAALNTPDGSGNLPPAPSQISRTAGAQMTFPAGLALSPDGRTVYVACNGDNSMAAIDTKTKGILNQVPVGYFPYTVAVRSDSQRVVVSNWGQMAYKFKNPTYDASGKLVALGSIGNEPDGFYVPPVSRTGSLPQSSSLTTLNVPQGFASLLSVKGARYIGVTPDMNTKVGGTHPSAMAIVKSASAEVLYVTETNDDKLARINMATGARLADIDLNPISISLKNNASGQTTPRGTYPNALAVSADQTRLFVAEAGLNSVAVFDTTDPVNPSLIGRIPTGWYPTAVSVSPDGHFLYIANAKGVGEDINPAIDTTAPAAPTGLASDPSVDSNYIFGSLQQVDLTSYAIDNTTVVANNLAINTPADISVVPAGGTPSPRIKHVFFIMHENKTFDSMLGNLGSLPQFGLFAGTTFNNTDGTFYITGQFTGVSLNTQALASTFATGVNYYSDSEESDAGHQFAMSGTASDYTEKTLLVKSGRGLLVNKNFEPEDYPFNGYIFNNAARNNISFKDYGGFARVQGTDTGTSVPTTVNDPDSGNLGYPTLQADHFSVTNSPLVNFGDTTTPTTNAGLGQSYFMAQPSLAILGTNNKSGEPHIDTHYPGYNFNISDQRRAAEFNADFDRMVASNTLPQFIFLYQPNDHTGGAQAPNSTDPNLVNSPLQQVADGDIGLGTVVQHIMNSPVYYDSVKNTGSAIFMSYDDAQTSLDHIHPHRTPVIVISPFAKPGYAAKRHYSTASIVKTEELLLGLPPNNLGDLFATDMRDFFQPIYNGITASSITFNLALPAGAFVSPEGKQIWSLVNKLDTSAPDRDSRRLGVLTRLVQQADKLRETATKNKMLDTASYKKAQKDIYDSAVKLVSSDAPDSDD
jgi:YVTN family beta-propeller protein